VRAVSAVTERAFAEHRQRDWEQLDALARNVSSRGLKSLAPKDVARLSPLYRDVCADLARAQAARYSAPLVDYLQALTAAAHTVMYGVPKATALGDPTRRRVTSTLGRIGGLLTAFPRAVRRHWRAMTLATALFFVPFVAGLLGALADPSFAFRIVPEAMLKPLTDAYAKGFAEGHGGGDSALMAGFYVHNNVGIALRCFALGIFGGIGSGFYLVQNGLSIGAILGYVASQGAGGNILTFVLGHGSLELGAIVIAGGGGLAIGWSLVAPGERTRIASLQAIGADMVVIVFGASVMLLMAAGIEAFWSGSSVSSDIKRAVGVVLFVATWAYLLLAGRGKQGSEEPT
jgi:uncharacterized membrane protein SpoIIM required for sporulation